MHDACQAVRFRHSIDRPLPTLLLFPGFAPNLPQKLVPRLPLSQGRQVLGGRAVGDDDDGTRDIWLHALLRQHDRAIGNLRMSERGHGTPLLRSVVRHSFSHNPTYRPIHMHLVATCGSFHFVSSHQASYGRRLATELSRSALPSPTNERSPSQTLPA